MTNDEISELQEEYGLDEDQAGQVQELVDGGLDTEDAVEIVESL